MASNTTEAGHGAAEAAGHGAEAVGMPQLDFSTFANQIFWLAVALVAIYFILSRVALPRIGSVLAERKGQITNDIAAAEELKLKANEAEAAYDQALADARTEAQKIVAETRAEIQKDLDAATAKAEAEISARTAESEKRIGEIRASAEDAVAEVARATAGEIVAALGSTVAPAAVNSAVNARLKK
jgi:F-type H+-transporting ATPase subunit b